MTELNKKIKLGTILNLIILVVIYVLCYHITSSDFTGACEECVVMSSMLFGAGTFFLFIQGILEINMFYLAGKIEKKRSAEDVIIALVLSMIIMLVQISIVFSTMPEFDNHGEITINDFLKIDTINRLYNIGRILYIVMVVYYIVLIVMAIRSNRQMRKEVEAEK